MKFNDELVMKFNDELVMKFNDELVMKFNDELVNNKMEELINVEVGRRMVNKENANKIINILDLRNQKDLMAVRNSVVKLMGDKFDEYANKETKEAMIIADNYWNHLSAITAIIDTMIYFKGGEL